MTTHELIKRCALRAGAIQLDCFVAPLLAMTVHISKDVGITGARGGRGQRTAVESGPYLLPWQLV